MVRSHDIRVRPALSSDREFLFEVRRATLRAYVEQTSGWDDAEQRVTADKEFADLPFAMVEESGHPVGYVCVIHQGECDFIEEIALLPGAQGRGIGTQLLRGILRAAQQRGVPVLLSVFVNNPAQALYVRLGFEVVRIEDPRVSMRWTPGKACATSPNLGLSEESRPRGVSESANPGGRHLARQRILAALQQRQADNAVPPSNRPGT